MSTTNKRAPPVSRCLYMHMKNRLQLEKHKEISADVFDPFLFAWLLKSPWKEHQMQTDQSYSRIQMPRRVLNVSGMIFHSAKQILVQIKKKNYTVFPKYAQYLHSWKNSKHIKNLLEVLLLIRKMVSGSKLRKSPTVLASLEYARSSLMQCKTEHSLLGVKLESTGLGLTSVSGREHCGHRPGVLQDWGKQICELSSLKPHSALTLQGRLRLDHLSGAGLSWWALRLCPWCEFSLEKRPWWQIKI